MNALVDDRPDSDDQPLTSPAQVFTWASAFVALAAALTVAVVAIPLFAFLNH